MAWHNLDLMIEKKEHRLQFRRARLCRHYEDAFYYETMYHERIAAIHALLYLPKLQHSALVALH